MEQATFVSIGADARDAVLAEAECSDPVPPPRLPVIPPTQMPALQAEWHRSPSLRRLVRVVDEIPPPRRDRSLTLRALWEMSQSDEWLRPTDHRRPRDVA